MVLTVVPGADLQNAGPIGGATPHKGIIISLYEQGISPSEIFGLWQLQDVYTMLDQGGSLLYPAFGATQVADFSALNIYFDTGSNDDFDPTDDVVGFGIIAQHKKFAELLTS